MEINNAVYEISSPDVSRCPMTTLPEFAFIGRSNVGKSSLINMLCARQGLAKTSAAPGKTQLINHFKVTARLKGKGTSIEWYLVDLPGYGYAKVSQKDRNRWEQMIENYIRKRRNLSNLFVLIDSRHPPQKIDLAFVSKLGEWQVPFSIVLTKADKEKPGVVQRNADTFAKKLLEDWEDLPPMFLTSSEKKTGREDLLAFVEAVIVEAAANKGQG
jgi:GTP-binding protein